MSSNDPGNEMTAVDLRDVANRLFEVARSVALLADSLKREAGLLSALCDHLGDYKGNGED